MSPHRFIRLGLVCILGGFIWLLSPDQPYRAQTPSTVSGVVLGEQGPVVGATVRVQTTSDAARTNAAGAFTLTLPGEGTYNLTAWAPGYFNGGPLKVTAGQTDARLILAAHSDQDNSAYVWMASQPNPKQPETANCAKCHSRENTDLSITLPVDEWRLDAHSQAAVNPRFLTMYSGTDVDGHQSPLTRYGSNRDYGRFPLRPDSTHPYYGPGYKLDFPDTTGNCAACHSPTAAIDAAYSTDPTQLTGVSAEGATCDFCHKVWDVRLDPSTGMPYPNMPGVLSFEFRRPSEGHQFFAGPYDDVALPGGSEDTYAPLYTQSQYCAACHFGTFWDVKIYNSFGEWLDSPYSKPATGQTCQDCHMPSLGADYFARPNMGGLSRNPKTIFSHRMPGAADKTLLQNAAEVRLATARTGDQITVHVEVTNARAGHHIPTDSPLRQIFVVVAAADAQGKALALQTGPTLPEWAGDLKGLPGVYFAKILQELWTEVTPTSAYWMPTRVVEDTRLPALATNASTYVFTLPDEAKDDVVKIEAKLIFRRAYYKLMQQKGWNFPDILMNRVTGNIP